jgi:hypothetical protein
MTRTTPPPVRVARLLGRVAFVLLFVHALWVVLTHDWPAVAALFFVLAIAYEVRTAETLRRVRVQLAGAQRR